MNTKIKKTFDSIHAEEEIKDKTKAFLEKATRGYTKGHITHSYRRILSAAACLICILAGSYWLYFVPTAEISIDINPSIELSVNRFNQVVSVYGHNSDGMEIINSLSIKYRNYTEAIHQILSSEKITTLLSEDETLSITVIGPESVQCSKMLSDMESCTAGQENSYCYYAHFEEVSSAHELELSYGKYNAYLKLQTLDADITPEQIRDMPMSDICDSINSLLPEGESYTNKCKGCGKNKHRNSQNGNGCRNKSLTEN